MRKKSLRQEIIELRELLEKFDSETISKAKKYDEIQSYLASVKLKAKSGIKFNENAFSYSVVVDYSSPKLELLIDENENVVASPTFKAINMLNLISYEDMEEIAKNIMLAKKKNKGEM